MSFFGKKKKTTTKIFGETLDEAASKTDSYKLTPFIVKSCVTYLNKFGKTKKKNLKTPSRHPRRRTVQNTRK
jgi:hypothetical protein